MEENNETGESYQEKEKMATLVGPESGKESSDETQTEKPKTEVFPYIRKLFDIAEFDFLLFAAGHYENNFQGNAASYRALRNYFTIFNEFPLNPANFNQLSGFGLLVSKFDKTNNILIIRILTIRFVLGFCLASKR